MMLEQLRYTWAPQGLEGLARFQVVGTSAGLQDLRTPRARLALELCAYSPPSSPTTAEWVSFGWVDNKGDRYVFRRTPIGLDEIGRPGNFAAHVLVGPTADISAGVILRAFWSSQWWTGDLSDANQDWARLPEVDLDVWGAAVVSPAKDPASVSLAVTTMLRERGARVVLGVDPDTAVRAALRLADGAPGLLGNGAFSTFERGKREPWFAVLGSTGSLPERSYPTGASGPEERAAAYLARAPLDKLQRIAAATKNAGQGSNRDTRDLVVSLCTLFADIEARQGVTPQELSVALTTPETALDVLPYESARSAFVAGILSSDRAFADLARAVFPTLPRDITIEIGREALQQAVEAQVSLSHACATAGGPSSGFVEGAATQYLHNLDRMEPALQPPLPSPVLAAAFELTFSGEHPQRIRSLVARAAAQRIAEMDEPLGPDVHWDAALQALLGAGAKTYAVARLLSRNRKAILPAWRTLSDDVWTDVIRIGDPNDVEEVVTFLDPDRRPELFWSLVAHYVSRVDAAVAWGFLYREILSPPAVRPQWAGDPEVLLQLVRCRANDESREPMLHRELTAVTPLLLSSSDPTAHAWGELLAASARTRSPHFGTLLRRLHPEDRALAREYLFGVVVEGGFQQPGTQRLLQDMLDERGADRVALTMLLAAHKASAHGGPSWQESAAISLQWLSSWIDSRYLKLDRGGQLPQPLQRLAVSLLHTYIDLGDGGRFVDEAERRGGRGARWVTAAASTSPPSGRRPGIIGSRRL